MDSNATTRHVESERMAELIGKTVDQVQEMCRLGLFPRAFKRKRRWQIPFEYVQEWVQGMRPFVLMRDERSVDRAYFRVAVVVAHNETEARFLAAQQCGVEGQAVWRDERETGCTDLRTTRDTVEHVVFIGG